MQVNALIADRVLVLAVTGRGSKGPSFGLTIAGYLSIYLALAGNTRKTAIQAAIIRSSNNQAMRPTTNILVL
jgi:hypothetical protein